MATFEYNALTSAGRLMKGTIEAASPDEVGEQLKQMQLTVNSIDKAKLKKPQTAIGRNQFMLFNQQLASIAKAGIPLEKGLRELSNDVSSKSMRKLINDIAGELETGVSIEEAFEKRQKRFPPLYGEAMSYPAVILTLGSIVITAMFLFVIPQFKPVLHEMISGRLNPITTAFFTITANVIPFWICVGVFIAVILVGLTILSSSAAGRRFKESLFMKIPVIGRIYHSGILGRMAEAMAMMIAAGCDMPDALRLSAGATGSEKLIAESEAIAEQIEQGTNILEAGQFCRIIPRLFLYSIQLGTQRNELQDNLYSLGQMYAEQARCGQSRLQAVLLPVMLIIVGSVIATAVLAMFLPMIQVITSLGSQG